EKAVSEVESMEKRNQVWQVRDAYLKLLRWVSILLPEADALKQDVNAVTGGVQTAPELSSRAEIEPAAAAEKEKQTITIPERFRDEMQYRRPDWSYQPAYYQPVNNSMSSLMMMGMMLSQWDTNRRLGDMDWQMHHNSGWGNQ